MAAGLDVLRLRDFRLVFGAALLSLLGDGMVPVALSFAVLDLTGSATDLGAVLAAGTVGLVGSLLIGGVVADRVCRRAVMIGADLARLAAKPRPGRCSSPGTRPLPRSRSPWHASEPQPASLTRPPAV